MSSDTETDSTAIADNINGFDQLYPRNVGGAVYSVLSTRGDEPTAYEVNIETRTCECPDDVWNKDGHEVCDHVAVALFYAPRTLTIENQAVDLVLETLREHRERRLNGPTTYPASEAMDTDGSDSASDSGSDTADSGASQEAVEGAVGAVEAWLTDVDVDHSQVQVSVGSHGSDDGVRVDWMKADLGEKDHEYLKKKINDVNGTTYHAGWMDEGCQTCGSADGEGFYHFPVSVARGL